MSRGAIRYAKAVLGLAEEKGNAKEVFGEMKMISQTLNGNEELRSFLGNPVIKLEDKKAVLLEIFTNTSEITSNLLGLLSDNKRTELLQSIADNYVQLYNRRSNAVEAEVITAVELNKELENKVLAKVKELTHATEVTLINKVDPAIIGGFVLRVGDLQYDASIVNHFEKLKKSFNTSI